MIIRYRSDIISVVLKSLLLLSGIFFNTLVYAQVSNIRFHQLSLEDGLSHSLVSDMVEDDLGFLWLGTQDGLNRYDGYGFRVYYAGTGDKTPSKNWITDLYKDKFGQIWVYYRETGLD